MKKEQNGRKNRLFPRKNKVNSVSCLPRSIVKNSTAPILLCGTAETCVDIQYATGFKAVDQVIVVQSGRSGLLIVPPMEAGRARREASTARVQTPDDLGLVGEYRVSASGWALGYLKKQKVRTVRVSGQFPLGLARRLEKAGIKVKIEEGPLFPGRIVKRPGEIAELRKSQRAAVAGMRRAVDMIAKSRPDDKGRLALGGSILTADLVRNAIEREAGDRGCSAIDTIVACGRKSVDPHERGKGPLRINQPIVMDIFPRDKESGYWGDLTRTAIRGTPSRKVAAMHHAVSKAQKAALKRVKAGVFAGSVHQAAADELVRQGFQNQIKNGRHVGFIHTTGHGVGLEIHEAPAVAPSRQRLRAGMVITVEPGLYYSDVGGVRIEDTVVVTTDGYRLLARCPAVFAL